MEIREIKDKNIWEDFLTKCEEKTFLQSWSWGEFNKLQGNKIWRFGIYYNNDLIGVVLTNKLVARRGTFLSLPHGPVMKYEEGSKKYEVLKFLLEELKKIAKEEKANFIRISPPWKKNEENEKIFKNLNFKNSPLYLSPELMWELNISPSEEELLVGMRKTTRYLIRQAMKDKDIEISSSQKVEDLETFEKAYEDTVKRHHFVPYSFKYLKNEFLSFQPDGKVLFFHGKYKGKVLYSALIIFWQDTAVYHHAATSLKYPKIPITYLAQWEIIKEAKRRGCKLYNFWGIAPENNPKHPWTGLSLFKKGFGGYEIEFVKTKDLPLSWKYWLTHYFEKLRKTKRGL
jgi:peptidoglycan pentaglycine glycine transferase (the first glycine)